MTLENDYTVTLLARQRQAELWAQAEGDRLARLAMAGRPRWWQRLFATFRPRAARRQVAARGHRVAS